MPFTDRNHILLKLAFLACVGLIMFWPKPSESDRMASLAADAYCSKEVENQVFPLGSWADDSTEWIISCINQYLSEQVTR